MARVMVWKDPNQKSDCLKKSYVPREVRAMVIFGDRSMVPPPPLVNPCAHIEYFFLDELIEQLEKNHPDSPLIAVFAPLVATDNELACQAESYDDSIKDNPSLSLKERKVLSNIFINFITQRFKHLTTSEIYKMIAHLTPIEETEVGKEPIEKSMAKGFENAVTAMEMIKSGKIDHEISEVTGLPLNAIRELRKKVTGSGD